MAYFLGSIKLQNSSGTAPTSIKSSVKIKINEHDRIGTSSVCKPNGRKAIPTSVSFSLNSDMMKDKIEDFFAKLVQMALKQEPIVFASGTNNVWNRIWGKVYIEDVVYDITTDINGVKQATGSVSLTEAPKVKKQDIYTFD